MLFTTDNHDLLQALAYTLRGVGTRYEFELDDLDVVVGLAIYDEDGNQLAHYFPGEVVDPKWVS